MLFASISGLTPATPGNPVRCRCVLPSVDRIAGNAGISLEVLIHHWYRDAIEIRPSCPISNTQVTFGD
jgi:hypothetical protein